MTLFIYAACGSATLFTTQTGQGNYIVEGSTSIEGAASGVPQTRSQEDLNASILTNGGFRSVSRWAAPSSSDAEPARPSRTCGGMHASPARTACSRRVQVALVFGLTITALAYSLGHISGAHFNPAVTLSLWLSGNVGLATLVLYTLAQVGGAILGAGGSSCAAYAHAAPGAVRSTWPLHPVRAAPVRL